MNASLASIEIVPSSGAIFYLLAGVYWFPGGVRHVHSSDRSVSRLASDTTDSLTPGVSSFLRDYGGGVSNTISVEDSQGAIFTGKEFVVGVDVLKSQIWRSVGSLSTICIVELSAGN